jgi:hypothetical protein
MEYLTLQDIPHRHFNSLSARRMASPDDPREKAGASLPGLAAVCEAHLLLPRSVTPPLVPSLPLSLPLPPAPPPVSGPQTRPQGVRASLAVAPPTDCAPKTTPLPRLDSLYPVDTHIDPQQSHHMRNSPPFQPGEQRQPQNSLPSFSQVSLGTACADRSRSLTRRS